MSTATEQKNENRVVKVVLTARDEIVGQCTPSGWKIQFVGCHQLSESLQKMKSQFGADVTVWPLPKGADHSSLLLKEFILKANDKWQPPYQHEEICHCRKVSTETVEQAIKAGAHSTEVVSRWTSASTACGTCKPDVQKMIDYFLLKL